MDGTSTSLMGQFRGGSTISDVRLAIDVQGERFGVGVGVSYSLFVEGTEDALGQGVELRCLFPSPCLPNTVSTLFLLQRTGQYWGAVSEGGTISGDRQQIAASSGSEIQVTGGIAVAQGLHYWEVVVHETETFTALAGCPKTEGNASAAFGVKQPDTGGTKGAFYSAVFRVSTDDRIGVLIDHCDSGWSIRFYFNGLRYGDELTGMQGPLAICGEFGDCNHDMFELHIIPGAEAPMWAGGEHDEPGNFYLDSKLPELKQASKCAHLPTSQCGSERMVCVRCQGRSARREASCSCGSAESR
jgi:hypothetical protein